MSEMEMRRCAIDLILWADPVQIKNICPTNNLRSIDGTAPAAPAT